MDEQNCFTLPHLCNKPAEAFGINMFAGWHNHTEALLSARLTGLAISEALASVGVLDYRRAVTRVSARMPTAAEAALLRMPRSRPLLVGENINVDGAGRVVEFGIARYPTPRVQVVFEP